MLGKTVYYSGCDSGCERSGTARMSKRSNNYIHAYRVQNEMVGTSDIYVVSMSSRSISPGSTLKDVS